MRTFSSYLFVPMFAHCWIACVNPAQAVQPFSSNAFIANTKHFEKEELPPNALIEPVPLELTSGDWVEPLEQGEPAPDSGMLLSEERAWRDGLVRLRYVELRARAETDRSLMALHREAYERMLLDLTEAKKAAEERAERSWVERHSLAIGGFCGFLLGASVVAAGLALGEKAAR
jgi:hypothetical protein